MKSMMTACRRCGHVIPAGQQCIVGLCVKCAAGEIVRLDRLTRNLLTAPSPEDRRHDSQPGKLIEILAGVFEAYWKTTMVEVLEELTDPVHQLAEFHKTGPLLNLIDEYKRLIDTDFADMTEEQQNELRMCARSTILKVLRFNDPVRIELREWAEVFGTIEESGCCSGTLCPVCEGGSCGAYCDLDPAETRNPLEIGECVRCATLTVILDKDDRERLWECHGFVFEPFCPNPKCSADLGSMDCNGGGKSWTCEKCGCVIEVVPMRGKP